ncbi:MAG: dipeptide ABC transporter ATP-binding protein [Hyphomicrobiales bacterium]|nr:dipeptide ABC transporter ATP-binding protein [Hyphomicrobiales bacterium]
MDKNNILEIKNFSLSFGTAQNYKFIIDKINISIPKGKTTAIVGESGSGKTLTALSILRLNPNSSNISSDSEISFNGINLLKVNRKQLNNIRGKEISMIFQEPLSSLNPLHTIEKQISEILIIHNGFKKEDIQERVLKLLGKVRILDPEIKMKRYPHQLSGGERQRVMIAMALANEPSLIIADEPTTALDVTVQFEILNLLKILQDEMGLTILFITHDLGIVRNFSDYVYVMQEGKVIEEGNTEILFNNPKDQYTKNLLGAKDLSFRDIRKLKSERILEVEKLAVKFEQNKLFSKKQTTRVLNSISFEMKTGETIGLVGESGSGKTTLGLAILRLIRSEGDIIFSGENISNRGSNDLKKERKNFQIVFQDPFGSLSPRLTIGQIIEEGLIAQKIELDFEERMKLVKSTLKDVGLEVGFMNRYPHEFSGGQRQRIAIARAIILRPKLIVLDEPTSSLDTTVQLQILNLLKNLQDKFNLSYLFISHDLRVIRYISDRVLVINRGSIVEIDHTENIFNNPKDDYTKKLITSAMLN